MPIAKRIAARFLVRSAGLVHVPPRMAGVMSRWLTSNLAVTFVNALPPKSNDPALVALREQWQRRNKLGLRYEGGLIEVKIDLAGWRYLSKVDEADVTYAYRGTIVFELDMDGHGVTTEGSWNERGIIGVTLAKSAYDALHAQVAAGDPFVADKAWRNVLSDALDTLHHEMTHMVQAFLEIGVQGGLARTQYERVPSPGLPSRQIMTPHITQHLDSAFVLPLEKYERRRKELEDAGGLGQAHELDDVEFYTLLAEEIRVFRRKVRGLPNAEKIQKFLEHTGARSTAASAWFATLKRHAPGKWRKAVREMTKALKL